jgi:hypothetical protein
LVLLDDEELASALPVVLLECFWLESGSAFSMAAGFDGAVVDVEADDAGAAATALVDFCWFGRALLGDGPGALVAFTVFGAGRAS